MSGIARVFLLEVQYRISKGWATTFDPGRVPRVTPEAGTEEVEWRPHAIFESRGAACEFAYDRGYVDYRVAEITMNPIAVKREHREILP